MEGGQLDWMITVIFSSLNDSTIVRISHRNSLLQLPKCSQIPSQQKALRHLLYCKVGGLLLLHCSAGLPGGCGTGLETNSCTKNRQLWHKASRAVPFSSPGSRCPSCLQLAAARWGLLSATRSPGEVLHILGCIPEPLSRSFFPSLLSSPCIVSHITLLIPVSFSQDLCWTHCSLKSQLVLHQCQLSAIPPSSVCALACPHSAQTHLHTVALVCPTELLPPMI